jgi:quinol monooxygenase YgiN
VSTTKPINRGGWKPRSSQHWQIRRDEITEVAPVHGSARGISKGRDHREDIMETIRIIATFTAIAPENREHFKATVHELTVLAASEEGTLEYSYYLTGDETQCLMIEMYASADALLDHMGHVGHLLGPLFELGGSVDVNILGDAPQALIEATKDYQPTTYSLLASA